MLDKHPGPNSTSYLAELLIHVDFCTGPLEAMNQLISVVIGHWPSRISALTHTSIIDY
jgi:hypothetical protein